MGVVESQGLKRSSRKPWTCGQVGASAQTGPEDPARSGPGQPSTQLLSLGNQALIQVEHWGPFTVSPSGSVTRNSDGAVVGTVISERSP